jgi:hypothetical protein
MSAVAATGLAIAACSKPKPGGKCDVGQAICENSSTVLACQGDVFVQASCHGPGGCTKLGTRVTCDDSIANEGDRCLESGSENRACSGDHATSLLCRGGKFTPVQVCHGPRGCEIKGDFVTCDAKIADKGDLCAPAGSFACTTDKKSRLVCGQDGKFAFDRHCRGPTGCHDLDLACDETVSELGDPCGVSGMFACNTEGTVRLVCSGGQYGTDQRCPKGCNVLQGGRIECL